MKQIKVEAAMEMSYLHFCRFGRFGCKNKKKFSDLQKKSALCAKIKVPEYKNMRDWPVFQFHFSKKLVYFLFSIKTERKKEVRQRKQKKKLNLSIKQEINE